MPVEVITEILNQALLVILFVIGPSLLAAMSVGLFVAVMQAATQIQEASLSFVPKLVAIGITLIFTGNWSMSKLVTFFNEVVGKFQIIGGG